MLFYRRTFPVENFKRWLWAFGTLSVVWFIIITCFSLFQCKPVAKIWDDSLEGKCMNYLHVFLGIQAFNIALDIAILCLPISAVLKLQLSRPKKFGVTFIFALSGLWVHNLRWLEILILITSPRSVVFAIIRLWVLIRDQWQTDITCKRINMSFRLTPEANSN